MVSLVSHLIGLQSSRLPDWVNVLTFRLGKVGSQPQKSSSLGGVLAGLVGERVSTIPISLREPFVVRHNSRAESHTECRDYDDENGSTSPLVAPEYRAEPA
jgi:hypothetical protein